MESHILTSITENPRRVLARQFAEIKEAEELVSARGGAKLLSGWICSFPNQFDGAAHLPQE